MTIKDDIIALLNKVQRKDAFLNDFTEALKIKFQAIIDFCESVRNNQFFDSLDNEGAAWWEDILNIIPTAAQTLTDRCSKIQAKYLSNGHNMIALIQRACDSWKNGETEADFVNGKIQVQFTASYGVPADLDSLKESVEEIKPAHLPVEWLYKHLLKKDIHKKMTKSEMQTYKKHQYCDCKIGE